MVKQAGNISVIHKGWEVENIKATLRLCIADFHGD